MSHQARRVLTCAALLALAAASAADGRSLRPAKLELTRLTAASGTVEAGRGIRATGRVANGSGRRTTAGRLTFSMRRITGTGARRHLRGVDIARLRGGRVWRFSLHLAVPRSVAPGRYTLRACVRRRGATGVGRCRSLPVRVTAASGAPASAGSQSRPGPAPGPTPGSGPGRGTASPDAGHSLRPPVTAENFYFLMADRFENGRTDNDRGGLPADRMVSGYDPTHRGFYHGGDLKGLRDRIDYIRGLGTTSIWLTPSFKNRAVQPEDGSAGYHGYWITDFTQIDPHLGTNAELRALIDAAHTRGMKVYFDIITNHTADVIDYREAHRPAYVSKDRDPFRMAGTRTPFDDRDDAGTTTFPALDAADSFPFTPFNPPGSPTKVPSWLNDVTLYHNRGNTTFTGEDSLYGDFFGLDDLFTEHPRVVRGMEEIYEAWIRDFGIDGFRIDTMKHVNDEFWQQFGPNVLEYARAHGKREFFMFGEVFDTTRSFTSHFTTHDQVQGVLDFPFQAAAQGFAANSAPTDALRDFFVADDWYTDADSNVYQLPTFLGNHDMGRIGMFVRNANAGATDAEVLARDRLAHELMYFSRGNPVIYYGDEQGFVGDGGDQLARQDMFPSRVAEYNDDDLIGTSATTAQSNFDPTHPLYRSIASLADVTSRFRALRDGAHQHRYSTGGPGIYAFSRLDRGDQHEFVVALNNAETAQTAAIPTYGAGAYDQVYGPGGGALTSDAGQRLTVTVPGLSAVVYRSIDRIPVSGAAPSIALSVPPSGRDRVEVGATVAGDSFYEVTFLAKVGGGDWAPIGTDDTAPYRVFPDVSDLEPGTTVAYRAVVLDNGGNTSESTVGQTRIDAPSITIEAPAEGARVRGRTEVRAVAVPDHSDDVVRFERRIAGGSWLSIGGDDSSPVYTVFDDVSALGLAPGTRISYRAVLDDGAVQVTSAERTVEVAPPPLTTAIVHYRRPGADYADWGLHLWGDAIADGVATTWEAPRQRDAIDSFGAVFRIPLKDDTKAVNFILHRPSGDSVPSTREPGGDRSFVPAEHAEIWLRQGDPAVYFSPPPP